jgi:hypothetical protein
VNRRYDPNREHSPPQTGKLDVRKAAAKLPEPPAEPAAQEALEEAEEVETEEAK